MQHSCRKEQYGHHGQGEEQRERGARDIAPEERNGEGGSADDPEGQAVLPQAQPQEATQEGSSCTAARQGLPQGGQDSSARGRIFFTMSSLLS